MVRIDNGYHMDSAGQSFSVTAESSIERHRSTLIAKGEFQPASSLPTGCTLQTATVLNKNCLWVLINLIYSQRVISQLWH